jgi:REP element-mobilizing transposase RayT
MPQSLARIRLHTVFSTKNRHPFLADADIRDQMKAYLGATTKRLGCSPIRISFLCDHVHMLTTLTRTLAVSGWVKEIKRVTSTWMKTCGHSYSPFRWQSGYGVFSVGLSEINTVRRYIENQETHHRHTTFKDEYRRLLTQHGIAFDERYVWD